MQLLFKSFIQVVNECPCLFQNIFLSLNLHSCTTLWTEQINHMEWMGAATDQEKKTNVTFLFPTGATDYILMPIVLYDLPSSEVGLH